MAELAADQEGVLDTHSPRWRSWRCAGLIRWWRGSRQRRRAARAIGGGDADMMKCWLLVGRMVTVRVIGEVFHLAGRRPPAGWSALGASLLGARRVVLETGWITSR